MKKALLFAVMALFMYSCSQEKKESQDYDFFAENDDVLLDETTAISVQTGDFVQSDSYTNKNRAYITAQDFVKQKLNYPKEAEFNSNVVHETDGYGKCIVLGKVTAKNAFGVRTEYVYKIWLSHNGGDWTTLSNWSYSKLIIEDTKTQKQTVFDNREKPTNDTRNKDIGSIDGIKCNIVESNANFTRIVTAKQLTESQLKRIPSLFKINTNSIPNSAQFR
ncbi:hypothetical protein FACS1894176_09440 [Bacteroidia bacterium]|nr:hypothetical protein FACS1894176_09440 [Bacteroidia bacterium]